MQCLDSRGSVTDHAQQSLRHVRSPFGTGFGTAVPSPWAMSRMRYVPVSDRLGLGDSVFAQYPFMFRESEVKKLRKLIKTIFLKNSLIRLPKGDLFTFRPMIESIFG
jgi:hypothetical protein